VVGPLALISLRTPFEKMWAMERVLCRFRKPDKANCHGKIRPPPRGPHLYPQSKTLARPPNPARFCRSSNAREGKSHRGETSVPPSIAKNPTFFVLNALES